MTITDRKQEPKLLLPKLPTKDKWEIAFDREWDAIHPRKLGSSFGSFGLWWDAREDARVDADAKFFKYSYSSPFPFQIEVRERYPTEDKWLAAKAVWQHREDRREEKRFRALPAGERLLVLTLKATKMDADATFKVASNRDLWFVARAWKDTGDAWEKVAVEAELQGDKALAINMQQRRQEAYRCSAICSKKDNQDKSEVNTSPPIIVPIAEVKPVIICPCCGKPVSGLLDHHWYQPSSKQDAKDGWLAGDYFPGASDACPSCNSLLTPSRLWNGQWTERNKVWMDHVLPTFELQKLYVKEGRSENYLKQLKETYDFPLQPPSPSRRYGVCEKK